MAKPRKAAAPAEPTGETVAMVPLADLYIHPLNVRSEPPAADIEALAGSIGDIGLLQNLAGYLDPAKPGGLMKRAESIGLSAMQARQILDATSDRPRHPITRGIE